jgi:hypothetical protein
VSEDTVHLENEALAIEDLEGRRWEEKISRGGHQIYCGDIAAGVSAATKSESSGRNPRPKPKICWRFSTVDSCGRRKLTCGELL